MKKISCIYIIQNLLNKKFYLGSTVDFYKRRNQHMNKLKKNIHHSKYLQNSVNLHGIENFEINIFQYCFSEETIQLEQYYLDLYNPEYNVSKDASCPMGGRKHSKETLLKFKSRIQPKGELNHNWGRKHTEEFCENKRKARIGYKHSFETKIKMKETAKKLNSISRINRKNQYVPIIDSNNNYFESMTECAIFWDISPATVCDILKGRHKKTRKGITFKYANV